MNERRLQRLESTIKAKVAVALARDMSDPRLGMVTVTRVELDRELALCKVFWSVLGGEKERKVNQRVLDHAAGWMRREVASVLQTRTVPRVEFVFDERILGAMRVESIIKTLREDREARGESLEPGDEAAASVGITGRDDTADEAEEVEEEEEDPDDDDDGDANDDEDDDGDDEDDGDDDGDDGDDEDDGDDDEDEDDEDDDR